MQKKAGISGLLSSKLSLVCLFVGALFIAPSESWTDPVGEKLTTATASTEQTENAGQISMVADKQESSSSKAISTTAKEPAASGKKVAAPDTKTKPTSQSTTPSDKKAVAPSKSTTTPDKKAVAPSKSATTPDKKAAAPAKTVSTPDKKKAAPAKPVTTADKKKAAPAKKATKPGKKTKKATKPKAKKKGKAAKKKGKSKTKGKQAKAKQPKRTPKRFFVWGTGSLTNSKDNYFTSQSRGNSYSGLIGIDYKLTQALKVSLFYSNSYSKSRTPFTRYTTASKTKGDTNNVFGSLSYSFNPSTSLGVTVGYSNSPSRTIRFPLGRRRAPTPVISKGETNLFSVSPSLNISRNIGALTGSFQFGYAHNDSYRKASTDTNNRVTPKQSSHTNSASFFADFSYAFRNPTSYVLSLSPFGQVGLTHNFEKNQLIHPDTRQPLFRSQDGWKVGSGLRFQFAKDISANAGWQYISSRSGSTANVVSVTLRVGAF